MSRWQKTVTIELCYVCDFKPVHTGVWVALTFVPQSTQERWMVNSGNRGGDRKDIEQCRSF